MNSLVIAAVCGSIGFAGGDVLTAISARRINGNASAFLLIAFKMLLYLPFMFLWRHEYSALDAQSLAWILVLGMFFTIAYVGFTMALQYGKSPALVGVIAGCFPASGSVVAIGFLGQSSSPLSIVLLLTTLGGIILIGLPEKWRQSFKIDIGILLALLPLLFWGIAEALLNQPVRRIHTQHGWFVVQSLAAVVMLVLVSLIYNRRIPGFVHTTSRKKAWGFVLGAGAVIGLAEALQAFALGSGRQIVIIETLLGSYPAVYFLIAHHIFREPLIRRQWLGIGIVIISSVLLSLSAAT